MAVSTSKRSDVQLARATRRRLSQFAKRKLRVQIPGTDDTVELPAAAVRVLMESLAMIAKGETVTVAPQPEELTARAAAAVIGVSEPFLIKQLKLGKIHHRNSGNRLRIPFTSLMKYKNDIDSKRLKTLDELAAQAQEWDMGY
ncbi:MAG TPA: DNA-binding protein [Planctomycetota bacterium]|nr:DNA-binding protein [Planctomycetota bacterium]